MAVECRSPRASALVGVHRQLLPKGQLDGGLVVAGSEECRNRGEGEPGSPGDSAGCGSRARAGRCITDGFIARPKGVRPRGLQPFGKEKRKSMNQRSAEKALSP